MTDSEKYRIKPPDEKRDYRLWRIHIEAACESKEYEDVLEEEDTTATEYLGKANLLTVKPLCVVLGEILNPYRMLQKLDEHYASRSSAFRITKRTELIVLKCEYVKADIGTHIDKMAEILEQLGSMNKPIPRDPRITLLIASMQPLEPAPVTVAVKMLADDVAAWESVTARLLE